jgi:hypothetical protein
MIEMFCLLLINVSKTNNHISPQTIKHKKATTYGIWNPDSWFSNVSNIANPESSELGNI